MTSIVVTHDLGISSDADQVLSMKDGKLMLEEADKKN